VFPLKIRMNDFRLTLTLLVAVLALSGCPDPLKADDDNDGQTVGDGDCNDDDATVFLGALDLACDGIDQSCSGADRTDRDGDGVSGCTGDDPFDCDDEDATSFPGNTELCDGVDHDCDGDPTNGLDAIAWWDDVDEDGFGAGDLEFTCDETPPTEGYIPADDVPEDCDDDNSAINPDATEVCDGDDNDCDSDTDEGFDGDGDEVTSCGDDGQAGTLDDDCDDSDSSNYPGNTEVCDGADNDCDEAIDNGLDADNDGVTPCGPDGQAETADDDCDDANAANFPGNVEVCDGDDNDCDGLLDNGFDVDTDGVTECGPDGQSGTLDDDCDDADANNFPGNTEVCDGGDNNCEFGADEGFDIDGDTVSTCGADSIPGTADDDCDDTDSSNFPGNAEVCDGADNDCDFAADNGFDVDGDGVTSCGPDGSAGNADDDCDDTDINNFPGNPEVCDAADNDCDLAVDNGFDIDTDGVTVCGPDGLPGTADDDCDDGDVANFPGNPEVCDAGDNDCDLAVDNGFDIDTDGVTTCGGDGIIGSADDDCDDSDINNFPGNTEVCDGVDNDCDSSADDGLDGDADGVTSCGPDGIAGNADDDCDDADGSSFPGASELCDAVDNDCDGALPADELDDDSDTWIECTLIGGATPPGVSGGDDCDDTEASVNPGATEICDGVDTDCLGGIAADESDADADNFLACTGYVNIGAGPIGGDDCDDSAATGAGVNPGVVEVCDLIDNNCDTNIDEGFDADGDTFSTCGADGTTGTADDDCDDSDDDVFPGAAEVCDGDDNDCDTLVDGADPGFVGADADADGDASVSCGGSDCDDNDGSVEGLDRDFDGESSCDGDCDDTDPTFRTTTVEACDGEDNDCNGLVDDGVGPDADGDGFDTSGCGFFGSDCDDTDPHTFADETYTSGYQKQCAPAVRPGYGPSWAYARLNLPSYFQDPQTGTSYLYFRGNHDPDDHQFGYASSSNGVNWGDIQGPIFGEDPTLGVWDGRRISHPSVAYVPGKARPYIMAYHALEDSGTNRRIGVATAQTAEGDTVDGTFKRVTMSGAPITDPVIDVSLSPTAVDSERVLNPSIWFDGASGLLHMWYTGRFGSPNQFAITHASCDTVTSDCGLAGDWTKTDTSGDGDPDIWLEGDTGAWDDDNVQQTYVMDHSDPGGFFGYELEVYYTGAGLSIGSVQGDIADSTSWMKSTMNPVLMPSSSTTRYDGESTTGRGVRYDATAGQYHMYYGTSVALPNDGSGEGTDPLWGPRNYSSGASYIAHAINNEPVVAITASSCTALSGSITDNGPDTVGLAVYDGSSEIVSEFFGTSTGNSTISVQSTTWTTPLALSAGSHTLTVVAEDAGGSERTTSVVLTCP